MNLLPSETISATVATRPAQRRRGWRRVFAVAGCSCAAVLVAFLTWTASVSYRYDAPFAVAAASVVRQAQLGVIALAVSVYDPCETRTAACAPAGPTSWPPADRIETRLPPGSTVTVAQKRLAIGPIHNERIVIGRGADFRYQPADEPRLRALREKYRLDEVVAAGSDEFERMVLLRAWARAQFRRADYQPKMDNFDALAALDRGYRDHGEPFTPGLHYDPCHFFPLLYAQLLVAMGHQSRVVAFGHALPEVWSNQHRKWVAMDAELNHHFELDGVPLDLVELLRENHTGAATRARLVRGPQPFGGENPTMAHLKVPELQAESVVKWFDTFLELVDLRNDWMTNHYFRGHPARSETNSLVYTDPLLARAPYFYNRMRQHTADKDEFCWTLNQAEMYLRGPVGETLALGFRTVTPNFDHFELTIDGRGPIRCERPEFDWKLHDGENTLAVRPVNRFGVRGIESAVRLTLSEAR